MDGDVDADPAQRPGENTSRTRYDAADGLPPSLAVVEALAGVEGNAVRSLPPLHDAVDPDALDALFAPTYDGTPRPTTGSVSFSVAEYDVTVESNGDVRVQWFE